MRPMCSVETYLLQGEDFVKVKEFRGRVPDPLHVEGAVVLIIGETAVLDFNLHDQVVWLWQSLISGLSEAIERWPWQGKFLGQPIPIRRKVDSEKQSLTIVVEARNTRSATAGLKDLINVLLAGGEEFCTDMLRINPTNTNIPERLLLTINTLRRNAEQLT
jgi:hypothetical protein